MKTSVIESPGHIVIREGVMPDIGDNDVLVRLTGTGVCASNLPVWEGREWFSYPVEPGAPGHEGYGVVVSTGNSVKELSPGDNVALLSHHAFAEYDFASASNVVKLTGSVQEKPFPGEPVACAVNVFRRSDIEKKQKVLVIGTGFLGCMLIQLLKNAGAEIMAISRRETSLEYAHMAGADHIVRFDNHQHTVKKIYDFSHDGVPRVIEATGYQEAIDLASEVIAVRGKMIIAGYHQEGLRHVNMQVWNWKGIDVINAHERDTGKYMEAMKDAVELTETGILQPEKYITHYVSFNDINEAFVLLRNRPESFLKAVITY